MQREVCLEKILWEKIDGILKQDSTSQKNNHDADSIRRSLLEVQMLSRQLYSNNDSIKTVISKHDLLKDGKLIGNTENVANVEMMLENAREIALTIGLEYPRNGTHVPHNGSDLSGGNGSNGNGSTGTAIPLIADPDLTPRETAEKIEKNEVRKVKLDPFSTFILAILAGAFIALGGIYFTFATGQVIVTRPFTQVIGGLAFSMGLMFVVITGAQLFTNNLSIMGLASKKIQVLTLLKNWSVVYVGNAVGAVLTALVLYMSKAWTANDFQYGVRALTIASHKVSLGFVDAFFLGILCNCFVCLAIWLAASGKKVSDKILAILFPISAFVALGFEHSVANMYFLSFGFIIKNDPGVLSAMKTAGITIDTSHIDYTGILGNLLPVTLGNIVGGSVFVGLMCWLAYLRHNKGESK